MWVWCRILTWWPRVDHLFAWFACWSVHCASQGLHQILRQRQIHLIKIELVGLPNRLTLVHYTHYNIPYNISLWVLKKQYSLFWGRFCLSKLESTLFPKRYSSESTLSLYRKSTLPELWHKNKNTVSCIEFIEWKKFQNFFTTCLSRVFMSIDLQVQFQSKNLLGPQGHW